MAGTTAFPTALDTTMVPDDVDGSTATLAVVTVEVPTHSDLHNNQSAAIRALQAKVGIDASLDVTSVDYKLARLQSIVDSLLAANVAVVGPSSAFLFVGEPVDGLTFDIIGGAEPFAVDLIGAPVGVTASISVRTVTIDGTPTTVSAPSVRVVATDDHGRAGETECVMDVLAELELTGDFDGSVPFVGTTWDTSTATGIAFSGGDLTATRITSSGNRVVRTVAPILVPSYFEIDISAIDGNDGVGVAGYPLPSKTQYVGQNANSIGLYLPTNEVYYNNATVGNYTDGATGTQTVGVAFKPSTREVWLCLADGVYLGGGDPAAGTSPTYTAAGTIGSGDAHGSITLYNLAAVATLRAGGSAFAFTVPAGFDPGIAA